MRRRDGPEEWDVARFDMGVPPGQGVGTGTYGVPLAKGNPARVLRMPDGYPLVTPTRPRPQTPPLLAVAVPGGVRSGGPRARFGVRGGGPYGRFRAEPPLRVGEEHH
ncbi:hypothetical protein GCM10010252_25180 [Streptomyces aureoverticillatus]|nr:hypothetical protein GCM10010252_25180 [Streptomyces aureoverticillatus]